MKLMKKLGMAMATTALGAMLIGGGTYALFTDTAENEGNTFTAGTLVIEDVTGGAAFSFTQYFNNLAPGDSESATITIKNDGSLAAWVKLDGYTDNGDGEMGNEIGDLFDGDYPLTISLDSKFELIPPGESRSFTVSYSFPSDAGDEYQGATGTVDIHVKAVQARNNTKPDNSGPISWD